MTNDKIEETAVALVNIIAKVARAEIDWVSDKIGTDQLYKQREQAIESIKEILNERIT